MSTKILDDDVYHLYIDDSGLRFPDKQQSPVRDDGLDHFALGGILIKDSDRDFVINKYKELCKKWRITYPLHSTEIRGKRNHFAWLVNEEINELFLKDLEDFLTNIPVIGFAAVVDRPGYNKRYEDKYGKKRWWLCKTAYSILIERSARYVLSKKCKLKVKFEKSGKREDLALIEYARELKKKGMPFDENNSKKYNKLESKVFKEFVIGEPKRQEKKSPLLQIADLYLYPMVRGGYYPNYPPYQTLLNKKLIIDALIPKEKLKSCGVKYSCFED